MNVCHRCYQKIDVHLFYDIDLQDEGMTGPHGAKRYYAVYTRTHDRPTCARCRHRIKAMDRLIRIWQRKGYWDVTYRYGRDRPDWLYQLAPLLDKHVRVPSENACGRVVGVEYRALAQSPISLDNPIPFQYMVQIEDLLHPNLRATYHCFEPEQLEEL